MPTKQASTRMAENEKLRSTASSDDQEATAVLAHGLWIARGCPIGSPEVDWFRAEEELRKRTESAGRGGLLKNDVAGVVSDVQVSQYTSLPDADRRGKALRPDLAAMPVPEL